MKQSRINATTPYLVLLLAAAVFLLFIALRAQFLLAAFQQTTDAFHHSLLQAEPYALNVLQRC